MADAPPTESHFDVNTSPTEFRNYEYRIFAKYIAPATSRQMSSVSAYPSLHSILLSERTFNSSRRPFLNTIPLICSLVTFLHLLYWMEGSVTIDRVGIFLALTVLSFVTLFLHTKIRILIWLCSTTRDINAVRCDILGNVLNHSVHRGPMTPRQIVENTDHLTQAAVDIAYSVILESRDLSYEEATRVFDFRYVQAVNRLQASERDKTLIL